MLLVNLSQLFIYIHTTYLILEFFYFLCFLLILFMIVP